MENLNAMFKAVKFPASIADLNAGLPYVNRNAFSHFRKQIFLTTKKK